MSEGTVTLTRPLWTLAMLLIICVNGLTMFEDNIVKVRQVKITGVQPNQVSGNGGTRLHITGSGFEVSFNFLISLFFKRNLSVTVIQLSDLENKRLSRS